MTEKRKHRILLANFADSDAEKLRSAGYNADLGYVGPPSAGTTPFVPYYSPHPVYDYDVYAYSTEVVEGDPKTKFGALSNLASRKLMEPLANLGGPPWVRIAFIGASGLGNLDFAGIPLVGLTPTEDNVSEFVLARPETFGKPELHQSVWSLRSDILLPLRQYATVRRGNTWPLVHFPLVLNRNEDQVACYGVQATEGRILYIVLPQLRSNASALLTVLATLRTIMPDLLPSYKGREWLRGPEFLLPEERTIDSEIQAKLQETNEFVGLKKKEREVVASKFAFLREILVATEAAEVPPPQRLSSHVRQTLEFLGFRVTDIDQQIRNAIRKEDFWVEDQDFFAITEVTGTASKNPKSKEYNDLLGRMSVIFKRSDLVPPVKKENLSGLLVVNFDIEAPPAGRPRLYSGDLEEIVEAAKEQSIGLLSTVDLHKIGMAVKEGKLQKEKARRLIKQFGRIEFR